jgi:hypothetical protein
VRSALSAALKFAAEAGTRIARTTSSIVSRPNSAAPGVALGRAGLSRDEHWLGFRMRQQCGVGCCVGCTGHWPCCLTLGQETKSPETLLEASQDLRVGGGW